MVFARQKRSHRVYVWNVAAIVLVLLSAHGVADAADFTKPYDPEAFHSWMDSVRARFTSNIVEERMIGEIPVCITFERCIHDLRKPALIWLTGWGGGRGAVTDIITFAREGYLVVTVDPIGVGARWSTEFRDLVATNKSKAFFTAMRTTAQNVSTVVDYLRSREDVLPDKIGLGGGSFGGFTTILAATMEKRIAVFLPVAGSCNLLDSFTRSTALETSPPLDPALEAEIRELDAFYHPERLYPSAICFVQSTTDLAVPPDNSRALYEKARPFYADKPERLGYKEFADEETRLEPGVVPTTQQILASHKVTDEMVASMVAWLAKYLRDEEQSPKLISPGGRKQPYLYDEPEVGNIGWIKATYAKFQEEHPDILIGKAYVDYQIPVLLIQDSKFKGQRKPTLLSLHGWGGNKMRTAWDTKVFTDKGYLVVAVDAYGKGERWTPAFARLLKEAPPKAMPRAIVQTVRDLPKVVDYLLERDDVDKERIGLVGGSMGGAEAVLAAATEKRVKAYVAVATPLTFVEWATRRRSEGELGGVAPEDAFLKELEEADAMAAPEKFYPTALLFVHNKNDVIVPPEGAYNLYKRLVPFYRDQPERLQWKSFDHTALPKDREVTTRDRWATHTEGGEEGKAAIVEWFERYLKGETATGPKSHE